MSEQYSTTLITKVLLPKRRGNVLTRQRLLNELYELVDRKLVILTAPAGYGKTTLLVDFADDLEHPVCWYSLDAGDQDPHTFLEHLILSLSHRFPDFGEASRRALHDADLSLGAPGVISVIVNEMVRTIPQWFVLVLDDHHRLKAPDEVSAIISRLLAYQSDQFLMVISSRELPQLPAIIPLTARGTVGGMGKEDLRFRAGEIRKLLEHNHDLRISEDEAAALAQESEGWITGLLLTAYKKWEGILQQFAQARASNQPLYTYLAQEVFTQQEPEVRDFLLASSILEVMSVSRCREVLGIEGAARLLGLLEDRNLFVSRLEERWYRYHHLFRDYLEMELRRQDEARWHQLHHRAAQWFRHNGPVEEAVRHYLTIRAYDDAIATMTGVARELFIQGRHETLAMWGQALPEDLRFKAPRLVLFQSRAAHALGHWEEALALTDLAEFGYEARHESVGAAYAQLYRCYVWLEQGRLDDALALGEEVLARAEEKELPVLYEAQRMVGKTLVQQGRLEAGEEHLRQALLCVPAENPRDRANIQNDLAQCLWRQGNWDEAIAEQEEVVALQRRENNTGGLADALNDLGFYRYVTGDYRSALDLLVTALDLARRSGQRHTEAITLLSLGELLRDLNAGEQAVKLCEQGTAIADELGKGYLAAYGREALGLALLRSEGDYAAARAALEDALARAHDQRSIYQVGRYEASLGLILAESGDPARGLELLRGACEKLDGAKATSELNRARFFAAIAHLRAGDEESAAATLERIIGSADPTSCEALFVLEGQRVPALLRLAGARLDDPALRELVVRAEAFDSRAEEILEGTPFGREREQSEPLRIFGFGPGIVVRDGEEISISEWGSAAARHLLFYLLLHEPCTRDQIALDLWPDLEAQKVKATFHTTKFRLNRALDRDALYFDGRAYQVHPELDYHFDVTEFERAVTSPALGDQLASLERAIDLYRGAFLEDCYDDWCQAHREKLHNQYLDALNDLVEALMKRRRYRDAIEVLQKGLAADEMQEIFHRRLMVAYALSGRRSQAIQQYQRCAEILRRELGAVPAPQTTELYRRLLKGHLLV